MIDIHSHILHGLDDGAETFEESIQMAKIAQDDGIKKIVATPHILNGIHSPNIDDIIHKIENLNKILQEENLDIEVLPGADVHLHKSIERRLKAGEVLTINNTKKYILLELPSFFHTDRIREFIFRLHLLGVKVVISHPERLPIFQNDLSVLKDFVGRGTLVQITAASLQGFFGPSASKASREMAKNGIAHILATDAHSQDERPPILSEGVKILEDLVGTEKAHQMVETVPRAIIEGKSI